jgi:putative oxidoreductase
MLNESRVGVLERERVEARPLAVVDPGWGIAAVRIMMGIILVVAGAQKWINGVGGLVGFFGQAGIPAPGVMAPFIAALELIGGLLILLGVRVRWVALLFVAEFLVAAFYVKMFNPRVGYDAARIDLMLVAAAVMLVLAGAGKLSFDEWWARRNG